MGLAESLSNPSNIAKTTRKLGVLQMSLKIHQLTPANLIFSKNNEELVFY